MPTPVKKLFFFLLLVHSSFVLSAQSVTYEEDTYKGYEQECKAGEDSAKADYKRGILKTWVFGYMTSLTFGDLMEKEYGVQVIYGDDIVMPRENCYSEFMNEQIKEKFGQDVFDKTWKKANRLDSAGGGDRMASFPGGDKELRKFIYCNLDLEKAGYSDERKGKVFLRFTVETDGKLTGINVLKSSDPVYEKEALRVLSLMPDWIFATENGKRIRQEWNLPILFDSEKKTLYCP